MSDNSRRLGSVKTDGGICKAGVRIISANVREHCRAGSYERASLPSPPKATVVYVAAEGATVPVVSDPQNNGVVHVLLPSEYPKTPPPKPITGNVASSSVPDVTPCKKFALDAAPKQEPRNSAAVPYETRSLRRPALFVMAALAVFLSVKKIEEATTPSPEVSVLDYLREQPPAGGVIRGGASAPIIGSAQTPFNGVVVGGDATRLRVIEGIHFESGSARMISGWEAIRELTRTIQRNGCPGGIIVTGHTDATGDERLNQRLSLRRANVVVDELAKELTGLTIQVTVRGEGSRNLLIPKDPANARNRRVEFVCQ